MLHLPQRLNLNMLPKGKIQIISKHYFYNSNLTVALISDDKRIIQDR